jgi:hypothetical protein
MAIISLEAWRASMRDMIKSVHLYDAAAAKGGWGQLTADDYGRIGAIVKKEYQFLERLANGISTGQDPAGWAGRAACHDVCRSGARHVPSGGARHHGQGRVPLERNVLHPADHCGDCVGETAKGACPSAR